MAYDATDGALIVEDDPMLLMFGADAVEDAGLIPYEARRAEEALSILTVCSSIVVLFTDIRLPGPLDGIDLAWVVHHKRPDIKIFMTSGYAPPDPSCLPPGAMFLSKPYNPDHLVRELRMAAERKTCQISVTSL